MCMHSKIQTLILIYYFYQFLLSFLCTEYCKWCCCCAFHNWNLLLIFVINKTFKKFLMFTIRSTTTQLSMFAPQQYIIFILLFSNILFFIIISYADQRCSVNRAVFSITWNNKQKNVRKQIFIFGILHAYSHCDSIYFFFIFTIFR